MLGVRRLTWLGSRHVGCEPLITTWAGLPQSMYFATCVAQAVPQKKLMMSRMWGENCCSPHPLGGSQCAQHIHSEKSAEKSPLSSTLPRII